MIGSVLVLGATGKSGRRLVPELAARGVSVRAASRTPGEGVVFDWQRPETFAPALAGMEAVYLVTPNGIEDPSGLVAELLAEAKAAGVRRVVAVSSMGVEFPGEPTGSGRLKVERLVKTSGLEWTVLRPGGFDQNFSEDFLLPGIMQRDMLATATGDGRVGFVDAGDIAAVAAAALTEGGHAGETYAITGPEALSFAEAAAIIGEAAGRPIGHRPIAPEELTGILGGAGVPADYAAMVVRDQVGIRDGHGARLTDVVERVTGRPAVGFRDYATGAKGAWVRVGV